MKQVPYKCRFGHITIRSFLYVGTTGITDCEECLKLVGTEISLHKDDKEYHRRIVRRSEKAVRI